MTIDEEEWDDIKESLVMCLQRARDEIALMEAHNEKSSVICLQIGNTLQETIDYCQTHFPDAGRKIN